MMPYDIQTEQQQKNGAFTAGLNRLVAQALAERSLTWFSAVGSLGLWVYAIIDPEPLRLAAAGAYSVLGHIVPLFKRS